MLKITHPIDNHQPKNQQDRLQHKVEAGPGPEPTRSIEELMIIKEKMETENSEQKARTRQVIAEMFLAGPLAWPDYPESEELEYSEEDYEEWIPLDLQDDQLRSDASSEQK
jgi:hypothetical protein